ncbi:MAG: tetratricopeptide repeat protein [Proteobacteria bacterium]|nr:tetratricopeptide repeat protein [Pseudomonadota bacterium]
MDNPKIIDGKYEIKDLLGGGGFSDVYLVEGPDGECALKLLKGEIAVLKKAALEEFKNEFSILRDMRHPCIASILDFGFDAGTRRYYYTSEIIRGRDIVNATKGKKLGEITELFVQALRALGYLHSFRVYHFDIKAANVLVVGGERPAVKIIDFGLAGIDPGGKLIGTPSYMAPEIIARERADGRADLYSLGVLWYSCLVRKNPFRAETSQETLSRHLKLIPPAPSHEIPTLPKWLDSIVMRLLEKNPANRFPTASAVIREMNRLGGSDYPLETRETLLSYVPDEGRFVGRAEELAALESDLAALKGVSGASSGCLVSGGVGIGKTRLLRELKYRAQLADMRIEWASASDPDGFRSWCEGLSIHLSEGRGLCAFMLDDAQEALSDEVMRAALLALVSRARRPAASASAWIALAVRPVAQGEALASLSALLPIAVEVKPFTPVELGSYVSSLTGLERPPEALIGGLFERTEGNPLFLTEVLRSLIEGGGLFDEHGRWNEAIFEDVGVDFSKAAIPRTVGGLMLDRFIGLPGEAQSLLQALAAAGRPATAVELGAWGKAAEPGPAIMKLVAQGVLDRAEGFAFRFHNALMGQVIQDSMAFERRTAMHDAIAAWLAASNGGAREIAEHRSQGSDVAAAFEAAMSLGEESLRAGRGEEAAKFIRRALDLVDDSDMERRVEVQMKLGEAYLIGHDYPAATEHFSAVEAMITASAGSPAMARWRAEVLVRLGGTYIKLGQFERARASLHDAKVALGQSGGGMRIDLTIQNLLGSIRYLEGDLEGARATFTETMLAARALPEGESQRVTNNDLGVVLTALGEHSEAASVLGADLAAAERLGDDLLVGRAHYNMAQLAQSMRDYPAAIESYKACIEVCRRSHNMELLLRAYNGLGNAYRISEDSEQSISFYERGMALHERTGDLRGGAAIAINMGLVESARKRPDAALDHLVPAVEYLRSVPEKTAADWAALSRGLLEIGDIAKSAGRLDEARARVEEARGIASQVAQAAAQRFWIYATLAEIAQAQGRRGEYSDLLGMLDSMASTDSEKGALADIKAKSGLPAQPQPEPRPQQLVGGDPRSRMLEISRLVAELEAKARSLAIEIDEVLRQVSGCEALPGKKAEGFKAGFGARRPPGMAPQGSVMIDEENRYDPGKPWSDYERVIMAKCLAANGHRVRPAAAELGIVPATLYSRMKRYGLKERGAAPYSEEFAYTRGMSIDGYLPLVFSAALEAAGGRAKDAIANLRVSQGYFYKVMKRARG